MNKKNVLFWVFIIFVIVLSFSIGFISRYIIDSNSYFNEKDFSKSLESPILLDNRIAWAIENEFKIFPDKELGYCLSGFNNSKNYFLDGFNQIGINKQSNDNMSFNCLNEPKITIAELHTHPNGICSFSKQDIISFSSKFTKNKAIKYQGIYCGKGKYLIVNNQFGIIAVRKI